MKKTALLFFSVFVLNLIINNSTIAQTTVFWRTDGPSNGNWKWGLTCEAAGDGQWYYNNWGGFRQKPDCFGFHDVYFDGNGINTMNLNDNDDFTVRSIFFTSSASVSRVLNTDMGRSLYLRASNGVDPKIENNSSASHTFNVPIILSNWAEINPVNGDLTFTGNISISSNLISVYGSNSKVLTLSGAISGTGGISLKQNSKLVLSSTAKTYTGATVLEAGTMDLNVSLSSSVTVKNTATLLITGTVTIPSLTIESGGKIIISSGNSLSVSGALSNSAGVAGLVIESGGSLISSNIVNATVERFITKYGVDTDKMYHFISSPVSSQAISPQFSDPPNNSTDDFYKFSENTYMWINFRGATVNVPNLSFGEINFVVGRGYLVAYIADGTKTFTGTLNSGTLTSGTGLPALTYTAALGANAGWNLMGNPYPSAIDWDNVTYGQYANMDNAVYIRDNASSTYKTWVGGSGTLTDGVIPAMQGFFVHANAASPSLFLENQDRIHGGTAYYKKNSATHNSIRLKVEGNDRYDETIIRFTDEATAAFDGKWDAYKLYGGASVPTFYSTAGEAKLSVNSLPLTAMAGTVPLAVEAGAEATYTISLVENSLSTLINVTLEDLKTGLLWPLSDQLAYTFTAAPGEDSNRFLLHFLNTTGNNKPVSSLIKVYSTPGKINISGVDGKAEILVRNMMGQIVMRNSVNGSTLQSLNTNNLPAGVYVVSVVAGKQTVSEKVVVK